MQGLDYTLTSTQNVTVVFERCQHRTKRSDGSMKGAEGTLPMMIIQSMTLRRAPAAGIRPRGVMDEA